MSFARADPAGALILSHFIGKRERRESRIRPALVIRPAT
jgi:hypothetical protein